MQVEDRSFLITGGSSGLGAACATSLVANGNRVMIADVNCEAAEQLIGEGGSKIAFKHFHRTYNEQITKILDFGFPKPSQNPS